MRYTLTLLSFFIYFCSIAQTCFWKTNKSSFYVGDKFVATLIIPEEGLKKDPIIETSNAIRFHFLEKNSIESEGKRTTFYRYQIIPLKGGIQHFPNVKFPSNKKLKCDAFDIHVRIPERNPNLKLEMEVSENRCYQHQPIDLFFKWKSAIPLGNLKAVNIDIPIFNRKDFKVYLPGSSVIIPKGKIGLPVSGNRIIADIYDEKINGVPYKVMVFRLTIVPETTGIIEINPSTLLCSYIKQKSSFNAYPAYFDNNLFDQEDNHNYNRLVAQSKPMKLEVKELPSDNRPSNFSGLFNAFDAELKLNKLEVKTGEPLQWQLEIRNYQHPEAFKLPIFETLLPDNDLFRYTQADPMISFNDSLIVAKKRIRINKTDIEEFPSIQIPYFDTNKGKFAFIETAPFELQVLQGEDSTYQSENDSINEIKKYQIALNTNGINQLYTDIDALNQDKESWHLWFCIILIAFPVLFWMYNYFQKLHSNPAFLKKQQIKKATRAFNQRDYMSLAELDEGISFFFNHAFDLDSKLITPQKIKDTVHVNCPDADIQPIIEFYAEYYKNQYTTGFDSMNKVQTESVKACVNQLSKSYSKK